MNPYKLQTIDIQKTYPGTAALKNISIGFEGGQVHALIGKNGAGKSTLVKILSGAVSPSSGKILLDGKEIQLESPRDAFQKGIAIVYQELSLIPELTVGENILFGRLPKKQFMGRFIIDWPEVFAKAKSILDELHVDLDVTQKVNQLGVAQQQVIEIAKAYSYNPSVILLDEPTSALAHHEVQSLFELIRKLAKKNVAIIYITHRLQELPDIADKVSVLRDGNLIGTIPINEARPQILVQMMFGQTLPKERPQELQTGQETVMAVNHLYSKNKLFDINLTLHRGEILGIAGMVGSGRTELLRAIMGADSFDGGEIIVHGQSVRTPTPSRMMGLGVGYTPENRKSEGLVQVLSTGDNITLANYPRISRVGVIRKSLEKNMVEKTVANLQIAITNIRQSVSSLSGGNQQKVVVGNWLNTRPKVMLFDEPTRGIDVQAKQQIFQIIWDLSRQGISSIFVSSELEELIEVCHRILILHKGRMVGEVSPEGLPLETLFEYCMEGHAA